MRRWIRNSLSVIVFVGCWGSPPPFWERTEWFVPDYSSFTLEADVEIKDFDERQIYIESSLEYMDTGLDYDEEG